MNFVGDDEMRAVEDEVRWLYVKKLRIGIRRETVRGLFILRQVRNWADEAMFGNLCRAIGLGSGAMSWPRSIAPRTLLRIEELVWCLDLRVGFCDKFKKRACHLF